MNDFAIVMYHYVRDLKNSRYPQIKGLDVSLFRQQIEWFVENCNVVTMEQVLESTVEGGINLPNKSVLLTFDDGYIDNYTFVFPILKEYGLQGSFFVPGKTFATHQLLDVNKIHYILACADEVKLSSELRKLMDFYRGNEFSYDETEVLYKRYAIPNRFDVADTIFVKRMLQTVLPERLRNIISSKLFSQFVGISENQLAYELYMTEEQIRVMKNSGMFFGLHGYDHYWLGNLNKEQMQKDIDMALETMGEFIDKNAWVMNYPYGSYNSDVLEYIKSEGAVLGLTTEVAMANFNKNQPLKLPRLDCNDFPPKSVNYQNYLNK